MFVRIILFRVINDEIFSPFQLPFPLLRPQSLSHPQNDFYLLSHFSKTSQINDHLFTVAIIIRRSNASSHRRMISSADGGAGKGGGYAKVSPRRTTRAPRKEILSFRRRAAPVAKTGSRCRFGGPARGPAQPSLWAHPRRGQCRGGLLFWDPPSDPR